MKKIRVLFVMCLIALFMGGAVFAKDDSPKQVNSTSLKATAFTAALNAKITQDKNLIFCSTFQLAWDSLKGGIIKNKVQLSGNPPLAQELNKSLIPQKDISPESYLAMAGYKKEGIIGKINKGLKIKFGSEAPSLKESELIYPDDILAYAFLYKNLKFKKEFEGLTDPITFNDGKNSVKVKAFGIKKFEANDKYAELAKQASIVYYKNDNDFVIKLNSTSPNDEIILAKIAPQATLGGTIDRAIILSGISLTKGWDGTIHSGDTLQIPKLDFDILHNYKDLEGKSVLNKGFEGYVISKALQSVRFRLNEKGALLKSEAKIVMTKSAMFGEEHKNLIFDKPFLFCLKEKGAKYPYLAIWVDNAEILVK